MRTEKENGASIRFNFEIDEEDIPLKYRMNKKTPGNCFDALCRSIVRVIDLSLSSLTGKRSAKKPSTPPRKHKTPIKIKLLQSPSPRKRKKLKLSKRKDVDDLATRLYAIKQSLDKKYDIGIVEKLKGNVALVFSALRTIDIYAEMSNTPTGIRKLYPDVIDDGRPVSKRQKADDKPQTDNNSKKKTSNDNTDRIVAWNFLEKVEEILVGANKLQEYERFIETLKSFDQQKERVAELYYKMENIFHPHHPELLNLFLTFLLPGQATQVGRFFEHFMITNMDTFITKLHTHYSKQPSQIKKVMACLNDLAMVEDVTIDTVRESIMPLLKGNTLLMDWFQQIFANERPIDCHDADSEVVKTLNDPITSTNEVYEELIITDTPQIGDVQSCGIKYGQGGISYAGRMCVLPAKLSFVPYDAVTSTSTLAKEPTGCSHAIKEYADTLLHEKSKPCADVHSTTTDTDNQNKSEGAADVGEQQQKIKVVNESVLKAHAIRLNPAVHSSKGETYADIADLLVTQPSNAEKYFSDDTKSPKKNTSNTRVSKKLNVMSPKPSSSKQLKSPQPSTSTGSVTISARRPNAVSGVLAKAKRLRAMIESDSDAESSGAKDNKKQTKAVGKVKKPNQPVSSIQPPESESTHGSGPSKEDKSAPTSVNWTRDEDKIILEEERNGYDSLDDLLVRLEKQLPIRSRIDITARYEFLMEILKKLQETC